MSLKNYQIKPESKLSLSHFDADDTGDYKKTDKSKEKGKAVTEKLINNLKELQERLYANGNRALLIVLQGMDTSGKDGTVRRVLEFVDPAGVQAANFKSPSREAGRW